MPHTARQYTSSPEPRDPSRREPGLFRQREPSRNRDEHSRSDAADGRVDCRGHDRPLDQEGRRQHRSRRAAVRDLHRQGGRRDPVAGRRGAARDRRQGRRDGGGQQRGRDDRRRRREGARRPGRGCAGSGIVGVARSRGRPARRHRWRAAARHRRRKPERPPAAFLAARPPHRQGTRCGHRPHQRHRGRRAGDQARHPRAPRQGSVDRLRTGPRLRRRAFGSGGFGAVGRRRPRPRSWPSSRASASRSSRCR